MVSGSVNVSEPIDGTPPQAKRSLSETLDVLSKAAIITVFASYVFGFLIVSIRDAEYGFGELNPLKPKILAAGALFAFLTFFPIVVAQRYFVGHDKIVSTEQKYARWLVSAAGYLLRCNLYGFSFLALYAYSVRKVAPQFHWHWRSELKFLALAALFIALAHFDEQGRKFYQTYPKRIIISGCLLLSTALGILLWQSDNNIAVNFELWLFGVGVMAVIEHQFIGAIGKRTAYNWVGSALLLIPMLALFATVVYPQIKTSWGGGSATPVVVYFSADSRILPGQHFEGDLLDESDNGIYLVKVGEKQAIFVPRSAISAMYFSDKPLGPEFVRDGPANPQQAPTQQAIPQAPKKP
jgi:hypothetical protein